MHSDEDLFNTLCQRIVVDYEGTHRYYNPAGELHRDNGPAVVYPDGSKLWVIRNTLHREDGPAIERADGRHWWYLDGVMLTKEEHAARIDPCADIW